MIYILKLIMGKNIEDKLKIFNNSKLVCKYYNTLLQVIKETTKDLKDRGKSYKKIKEKIRENKDSEELLKVFEIIKKLILENGLHFSSSRQAQLKKNIWNLYYQIWKELNNPNKEIKYLNNLNNLITKEYKCWYSKSKFFILHNYYRLLFFITKYLFKIVWYSIIAFIISTLSIYGYKKYNNDTKKTIIQATKYLKDAGLTLGEIKYLVKDNIIKNGKIIIYKNLSGIYLSYNNINYNLIAFSKNNIISSICIKEHNWGNFIFNKDMICPEYIDKVCTHKKYWINIIKKYINTKDSKIRKWLIYIKLLMKLWKCL